MTIRDEIAMRAMTVLMEHPGAADWSPQEIAAGAYAQADAMLEERLITMEAAGSKQ